MGANEYWIDGRRKRAVTLASGSGWTVDHETRLGVTKAELRQLLDKELPTLHEKNGRARREARRRIKRRIEALAAERRRRVNGL